MLKSTNILSDLAQKINLQRDHGRIGVSAEFEIDVLVQENVGRRYNTPEKPTEAGYDIADNTSAKPLSLSLRISTNEWNWRDKRRALEAMADKKTPIQYYSPIDKKIYYNMIIDALDFAAEVQQSTGFTADLQLKQIRIVRASQATFEVEVEPDARGTVPQSPEAITSEGVPQTDNMEGKAFTSDGILYMFNNRGGKK